MSIINKIGFGGGCHWCTEAVFQSLLGVKKVAQGWISSEVNGSFSEAVLVHFDQEQIDLQTLIAIHLHTHSSTGNHALRVKYRSAVYIFTDEQSVLAKQILLALKNDFEQPIITKVLPFHTFKLNNESYLDYYYKNPTQPFCQTYIHPKLSLLLEEYAQVVNPNKLKPL